MILVDMNHLCISTIMADAKGKPVYNENLIRHMILNQLRIIKGRFGNTYGELVLCYDSGPSWRKKVFPNYKAGRKKARDASNFDWNKLYSLLNSIEGDFREHFPYKVLKVIDAEADDIIATVALVTTEQKSTNKVLIYSSDEDYQQLTHNPNIQQYSPTKRNYIAPPDVSKFLFEHVVRGDSSDGVPNILSSDAVFVAGERQKPISSKKINEWYTEYTHTRNMNCISTAPSIRLNIHRNRQLIDFSYIPLPIQERIIDAYRTVEVKGNQSTVLAYLTTYQMSNLIPHVMEF